MIKVNKTLLMVGGLNIPLGEVYFGNFQLKMPIERVGLLLVLLLQQDVFLLSAQVTLDVSESQTNGKSLPTNLKCLLRSEFIYKSQLDL